MRSCIVVLLVPLACTSTPERAEVSAPKPKQVKKEQTNVALLPHSCRKIVWDICLGQRQCTEHMSQTVMAQLPEEARTQASCQDFREQDDYKLHVESGRTQWQEHPNNPDKDKMAAQARMCNLRINKLICDDNSRCMADARKEPLSLVSCQELQARDDFGSLISELREEAKQKYAGQ